MFLKIKKLKKRAEELKEYRYREKQELSYFWVCEDVEREVRPEVKWYENFPEEFTKMHVGTDWAGRDRYLWLCKEVEIPQNWAGKKVLGLFDFGKTGEGNNYGFESLLYVDGTPYQGVDVNHQEVFFDDAAGKEYKLTFRLWSGLEGGGIPRESVHKIKRAQIAWLDEKVDDLYYFSTMIVDALQHMNQSCTERFELEDALQQTFLLVDWSEPGSEEFYESLAEADNYLNNRIDAMDKHSLINVTCIGHTHIDVAWLWRLKNTREKCSRSFSTVIRLMEQYPEYVFLQTQPQLYQYIKEDFPEIYAEIKEKVRSGAWEPDGGMWVEADCNLISGESMTRQILLGTKFMREEFGTEPHYLWLPDVFGYSWAIPQILRKSGIDMFMTTKISWNQYNRMPHDTFKWKGMDGSEVLAHFITTPEPGSPQDSWYYTYNGQLTPETVLGAWEAYRDKGVNKDLLISYGYGDGGGGVNRDMLEQRRRIDKIPGLPNVKTGRATDFFDTLKKNVEETNDYVHTWDGELYLEYHRGTYTSHAYNKRMNRRMEFLYGQTEWLTAMAAVQNGDLKGADQEKLTDGWHHILTNQFHDIIPGSSINEVYEDSREDYEWIKGVAEEVRVKALKQLHTAEEGSYTIWNSTGNVVSGEVEIAQAKSKEFCYGDGTTVKAQSNKDGIILWVENVPAYGCRIIYNKRQKKEKGEAVFKATAEKIESPYYRIKLNENGQICSLYDKENLREVLPEDRCANVLQMFEDKPLSSEAWNTDIFYQEKMEEVRDLAKVEVVENGAVRCVLRLNWTYHKSEIWQDMILYADDRRIDFVTYVDFREKKKLLKAAFPVDIRATYATYDIQYGNVHRANNWNTSWEQAKFETVAHKWVDMSEQGYGVSLMNDCKYGHDVKDNVLRITLIKTAEYPDYKQDIGMHEFTYSLYPHSGDFVDAGTEQKALSLNQPLFAVEGKANEDGFSFINCDKDCVEIDAIKKSEDGKYLVVRFHEYTGSRQMVTVNTGFETKSWVEADLMERPVSDSWNTKNVILNVKPYEIKTILFSL